MPPCSPPTPLGPDTVHLWVVDVRSDASEAAVRVAATTAGERERADRFLRHRDGARYLQAHGALRIILARYLECEPAELEFALRPRGKPWLRGIPLEFNLAHSGDRALVGVAVGRQVGVDIEELRPLPDLMALAARVCGARELADLAAVPEPRREITFLRWWTRKEAWAKMTGEGLQSLGPDIPSPGPGDHEVMSLDDLPGYAAAIAATGRGWQIVRAQ